MFWLPHQCRLSRAPLCILSTTIAAYMPSLRSIMARILSLLALSAVVGASTIQHPLQENSGQAVINNKPLVSSGALESHITSENLLKRAKQLYKIAELGAEEYNHPTRVIGSKGRFQSTNSYS
jgi:hypothetical protein